MENKFVYLLPVFTIIKYFFLASFRAIRQTLLGIKNSSINYHEFMNFVCWSGSVSAFFMGLHSGPWSWTSLNMLPFLPDKNNLKEKGFVCFCFFVLCLTVWGDTVLHSSREAAVTSYPRSQHSLFIQCRTPVSGMVLPTFRMGSEGRLLLAGNTLIDTPTVWSPRWFYIPSSWFLLSSASWVETKCVCLLVSE